MWGHCYGKGTCSPPPWDGEHLLLVSSPHSPTPTSGVEELPWLSWDGAQRGSDCNAEQQLRKTGTGERRKCLHQLLKKRKARVWMAKTLPYQIKSSCLTPFYILLLAKLPLMIYCALWLPQFIHIRVYHPVCKAQQGSFSHFLGLPFRPLPFETSALSLKPPD